MPLQISHISVVARLAQDGRWAVEQAIEQVDQARDGGMDIGFDMHTRLFGTTNLSAALPPWMLEGDSAAIAARLGDPAARRAVKEHNSIITALARGDWQKIVLYDCPADPPCSRRSIADISRERGTDPIDTICDLLRQAAGDDLHGLMVIALTYREEDLRAAFAHPACMIGSDATALAPDGPLAGSTFHGAYTWASWFFRHFVSQTKTLTPQEAIRRLTSLPAARLGLTDRGTRRLRRSSHLRPRHAVRPRHNIRAKPNSPRHGPRIGQRHVESQRRSAYRPPRRKGITPQLVATSPPP